jgi:2,5-diamino-6-(ribosylamino)-4(3H)-pyrimidinone 5'-phosphate reductase
MIRPTTTLFMLSSVDGKISTGDTDAMDVDRDFPTIKGVSEGLKQYYDLEMTTDLFSLNSGRVFEKIGFNDKKDVPKKLPVTFVVIDNKPHLNKNGVTYLSQKAKEIIFVTTNKSHPAFELKSELSNVHIIYFDNEINFEEMFAKLKTEYGADRLTIQSSGTLNSEFIRNGFIDYISLVVAPAMIGGKDTPTLMDGESLHTTNELSKIKALELQEITKLNNSYIHLKYKVLN